MASQLIPSSAWSCHGHLGLPESCSKQYQHRLRVTGHFLVATFREIRRNQVKFKKYRWPLNNTGVWDASPLRSGKSEYNLAPWRTWPPTSTDSASRTGQSHVFPPRRYLHASGLTQGRLVLSNSQQRILPNSRHRRKATCNQHSVADAAPGPAHQQWSLCVSTTGYLSSKTHVNCRGATAG